MSKQLEQVRELIQLREKPALRVKNVLMHNMQRKMYGS